MPETATEIGGLAEVLRTHGIVRAVVIDDAFDVAIADTVSDEMCGTFQAEIKRDPTIAEELRTIGVDAAAVLKKDGPTLEALAAKRVELENARPYVETLLFDYLDRRALVDDLVRHLKTLELDVVALGADQPIPADLQAQIAFIDFYLDEQVPGEVEGPTTEDPSGNARAKARTVYDQSRAFVVLMSSRAEVGQEEVAFRKKARLLRGYFQFQLKATLSDDELLHECLAAMPLTAAFRHTLHDFIDCLDNRSHAIAGTFVDEVRDLGLEDYAQLRQLSLNKDGHPFGDYIIRLFGHFMTSLVLEDPQLSEFVAALDQTTFKSMLPIRAEPSATLGRIYLASLSEKLRHAITHQPGPAAPAAEAAGAVREDDALNALTALPPQLLSIELGDLFVKDASNPIYAVMNPACDLALGSDRSREPEDSVLLIPGSLRQLYESYEGNRAPTMFTPIYEMNGSVYRIDWDYRRLWTVSHQEIPEKLLAKGYRCERRLQLGPALELQQHFASSISRVGLPVPPPIRRSHDATLHCRNLQGQWEMITAPLKAAVVALHMRDKDEFIITKNATKPALDAIKAHIAALKASDESISWEGGGSRAQYARQLEKSFSNWSAHFPFLHATGSLPGGRDKERSWNKKTIEIKDRLGFARNVSVLTEALQNIDTVFVVDLSSLLSDQTIGVEELPREMEEN